MQNTFSFQHNAVWRVGIIGFLSCLLGCIPLTLSAQFKPVILRGGEVDSFKVNGKVYEQVGKGYPIPKAGSLREVTFIQEGQIPERLCWEEIPKTFWIPEFQQEIPDWKEGDHHLNLRSLDLNPIFGNSIKLSQFKNRQHANAYRGTFSDTGDNIQESLEELVGEAGDTLYEILKNKGYADTTEGFNLLSFERDYVLQGAILGCHLIQVGRELDKGIVVWVNMNIAWKVSDTYGNLIYGEVVRSKSSEFAAISGFRSLSEADEGAIVDALSRNVAYLLEPDGPLALKLPLSSAADSVYAPIPLVQSADVADDLTGAMEGSITVLGADDQHASGFIVSDDGLFITNYQLFEETDTVEVKMYGERSLKAAIVRRHPERNVAIFKLISPGPYKSIPLYTGTDIPIGESVFAIGTPANPDLGQSISKGIISGVRKSGDGRILIQTDASISIGNRGGVLATQDGRAIGVMMPKIVSERVERLAFAVPLFEVIEGLHLEYE